MTKKKIYSFTLTPEAKERLRDLAEEARLSMSALVELLILSAEVEAAPKPRVAFPAGD